jgi:hypothetical protein
MRDLKQRYFYPTSCGGHLVIEMGERLKLDNGSTIAELEVDDEATFLHLEDGRIAITRSPIDEISRHLRISSEEANRILRGWLSRKLGVPDSKAVETLLQRQLPALADYINRFPDVALPPYLSRRMFESLRAGSNLRSVARSYLADLEVTVDDARHFAHALDGGPGIGFTESRIWLMALVRSGSRRELVDAPIVRVGVIPPASISSITRSLGRRQAIDFALAAAGDRRSALSLTAAAEMGLVAEGNDGLTAYHRLLDEVMASEMAAPTTGLDLAVNMGINGMAVRRIASLRRAREVGQATGLCIATPEHGWITRLLRGEIEMVSIGSDEGLVGVIALSRTDPPQIIEAKGCHNAALEHELVEAFARVVGVTK